MTPWNNLIAEVERAYHDECNALPPPPTLVDSSMRINRLIFAIDGALVLGKQDLAMAVCDMIIAHCLRLKEEMMKSKPFGQDYWKGGAQ